ncbi:MAG: hypothetical protein NT030_08305 [Candidatus Saganbacteria bacterium]|nr:hypothetical protein [Candidatus Saganbacteria bacterium]
MGLDFVTGPVVPNYKISEKAWLEINDFMDKINAAVQVNLAIESLEVLVNKLGNEGAQKLLGELKDSRILDKGALNAVVVKRIFNMCKGQIKAMKKEDAEKLFKELDKAGIK